MMFDLFYRLLPRNLDAQPLHLNTFLPVFTLSGYATQNIFLTLDLYNNLEAAIVRFMADERLVMKGTWRSVFPRRAPTAAWRKPVSKPDPADVNLFFGLWALLQRNGSEAKAY